MQPQSTQKINFFREQMEFEMNKNSFFPSLSIKINNHIFTIILSFLIVGCSNNSSDSEDSYAYITNQKGNIQVLSLNAFNITNEIDVGLGARGLGITDDGSTLVVAVRNSNDLALVDTGNFKIKKRIFIGENPEFVRVQGNKAFVSFEPAAIGGPPPKPGSKEADKLQKKREENDEQPARIAVVDLSLGEKISEIQGGMETEGIEFSFDGSKIIVTNEADENLSVHEISTGALVTKIDTSKFGHRPRGVKRSPNGDFYIATIEYGNRLLKISRDFEITSDAETGLVPYGVTFSSDGNYILVALSGGQAIQVFDSVSLKPVREITTGNRCWHFSFTPDEKHIIAACGRSNEILVINYESGEIHKKFSNQKMPWGIITYPKSMGSLDIPKHQNGNY
jgi:DNA-binding beta-propeller fold protein YncE